MLKHYPKNDLSQELLDYLNGLTRDEIIEIVVQFYESYYLESEGYDDVDRGIEYEIVSKRIKRAAINRLKNMVGGKHYNSINIKDNQSTCEYSGLRSLSSLLKEQEDHKLKSNKILGDESNS